MFRMFERIPEPFGPCITTPCMQFLHPRPCDVLKWHLDLLDVYDILVLTVQLAALWPSFSMQGHESYDTNRGILVWPGMP